LNRLAQEEAMNGVHDMGGMQGYGTIKYEANEPTFHEEWEARLVAMRVVVGPKPGLRPGGFRFDTEQLDPVFYLSASYYERWLAGFESGLIERGLITPEELAERVDLYSEDPAAPVPARQNPDLARNALTRLTRRVEPEREDGSPRFKPGDRVRTRNIHPRGHTRMPRYVRGKQGEIARCYGARNVLDFEPGDPIFPLQPVYSVRFAMQELWGESAENGEYLYVDLWEKHLEPAAE
jgi:nitrile hydratase